MDPRELMDPGGPDAAARSQKSPSGGCYKRGTEAAIKTRGKEQPPDLSPRMLRTKRSLRLSLYILFFKWEHFHFRGVLWITAKSKVPATWVPRSANWARWSRGPRVAAPQPAHSLTNGAGGAAGGPSPSSHPLWQPCQEV